MNNNIQAQEIHNIASLLFWKFVEKEGPSRAVDQILLTGGQCLFSQAFSNAVLSEEKLNFLPNPQRDQTYQRIKDEVVACLKARRPLNGIIYADDAIGGRAPSATKIDTHKLNFLPKNTQVEGHIDVIGELCVRHPLPAVVFSDQKPSKTFIQINSTAKALGFNIPMFMQLQAMNVCAGNLFCLAGTLYVPVPSDEHASLWKSVIPNANTIISGFSIGTGSSKISIDFSW